MFLLGACNYGNVQGACFLNHNNNAGTWFGPLFAFRSLNMSLRGPAFPAQNIITL